MVSKNEELTVSEQCRLLEVNRTTLYYKPVKTVDEVLEEEEYIKSKIDIEHTLHCVFGHRKLCSELKRKYGINIGRKKLLRYMKEMNIMPIYPKPNLSKPKKDTVKMSYLLKNLNIYWLEKLFLTLENTQDNVVLSGTVWLDETYYSIIMRERKRDENGNYLRGLSRNQICIGVATDKKNTICFVEGFGKPSQKRSYEIFKGHIAPGSTLIHDKEKTHKKLVEKLGLKSISYSSAELKGLADSENPLDPVNRIHRLLKMFLNAHSGFSREDLQNYLDLYSFVINPPSDHLEKVEKIINFVFENSKSLKYRHKRNENM